MEFIDEFCDLKLPLLYTLWTKLMDCEILVKKQPKINAGLPIKGLVLTNNSENNLNRGAESEKTHCFNLRRYYK